MTIQTRIEEGIKAVETEMKFMDWYYLIWATIVALWLLILPIILLITNLGNC